MREDTGMKSELWWIFDALIIILGGYVIFSNAKRGMSKVFVMAIGYIVSTVLASLLSAAAAGPLYESVARSTNLVALEAVYNHVNLKDVFVNALQDSKYGFTVKPEFVENTLTGKNRENFEDILYDYANESSGSVVSDKQSFNQMLRNAFVAAYKKELDDRMPRYVCRNFVEQVSVNPTLMRQIVAENFNEEHSDKQHAELMEDLFSREPCTQVLQIFIYLIIFSILMVFSAILAAVLQNKVFFNLREGMDRTLGGLLGLLEAGATIVLVTFIIYLIIMLTGNSLHVINEATVLESKVFSIFYSHLDVLL